MAIVKVGDTLYRVETVKTDSSRFQDVYVTELGDAKDAEFQPQIKLLRWNNECNLSLRLDINVNTFQREGGDLVFYGNNVKGIFRETGEGMDFRVRVESRPAIDYLPFTVRHKNIRAEYQGELTQFEIDRGNVRPPNVVGSYAIYHATKKDQEYKTGKIMHLYRPLVIDSDNRKRYADIDLDLVNNTFTISMDPVLLDAATYPIVIV